MKELGTGINDGWVSLLCVFGCVAGWDTIVVAGGIFVFLRGMPLWLFSVRVVSSGTPSWIYSLSVLTTVSIHRRFLENQLRMK